MYSGYTVHDSTFDSLTLNAGTTYMEANVTVGNLSVPAGATVSVANGGGLYVTGSAIMAGTATSPIILTTASMTPTMGQWAGIAFQQGSTGTLSYVRVSYAGSGYLYNSARDAGYATGILVEGGTPTIRNSTVDNNNGYGLQVVAGGAPMLSNDGFDNNSNDAVRYDLSSPGYSVNLTDAGLSATHNGHDAVNLDGALSGASKLQNVGIPVGLESVTVGVGARLDVGANTTLRVNGNLAIDGAMAISDTDTAPVTIQVATYASLNVNGTLNMAGTATDPISLTAADPNGANWAGSAFHPGSHGEIDRVHLSNAGDGHLYNAASSAGYHAGILVEGSSPAISHSTIDASSYNGVQVIDGGVPVLSDDIFAGNHGYAIRFDYLPAIVPSYTDLRAIGNGAGDVISVPGGEITGTVQVQDPSLPVRLDNSLTVDAGAQFSVGAATTLQIVGALYISGTVSMTGTATSPVTLTSSTSSTPGQWAGIAFRPGSTGTLNHVHLSCGRREPVQQRIQCLLRNKYPG